MQSEKRKGKREKSEVKKQYGHTLLELLVALTLALFISSALIEIFIQCKKNYDLTQRLNAMQTNARIAFSHLSCDIRMAGLIGCVRLTDFSPLNSKLTPYTRLLVWQQGADSQTFATPNLPRARLGSAVILLQFLDPNTLAVQFAQGKTISVIGKPLFHIRDQCLLSDCQHAEVFEWGYPNLKYSYQRGSEVGLLNKIVYYIGNTGDRTPSGKPIFALYRRNLNKSANMPIELVVGIEKMSVRLGVINRAADYLNYIPLDQVKNWLDVRSVEITLLLEDKNSFSREWKQVVALREPGI